MVDKLEAGERWQHAKRGTFYDVIGRAELQTVTCDLPDGADLVVYRGDDGKLWAREAGEFTDGRFVPVATPANGEQVERADGYEAAFYTIGDMLGIGATPQSPKVVWETRMLPALRELIASKQATPTEDARERVKVLEEALEWYAEQTRGCRKIGRDGDAFRQALDRDGGQHARTALGNKETDRHG